MNKPCYRINVNGQVAEWLNAAVLKTVIPSIVGSNPTLSKSSLAQW